MQPEPENEQEKNLELLKQTVAQMEETHDSEAAAANAMLGLARAIMAQEDKTAE